MEENKNNDPEELSNNDPLYVNEDKHVYNTRKRIQLLDNDTKESKKIKSKNNNNNSNSVNNNDIDSTHLKIGDVNNLDNNYISHNKNIKYSDPHLNKYINEMKENDYISHNIHSNLEQDNMISENNNNLIRNRNIFKINNNNLNDSNDNTTTQRDIDISRSIKINNIKENNYSDEIMDGEYYNAIDGSTACMETENMEGISNYIDQKPLIQWGNDEDEDGLSDPSYDGSISQNISPRDKSSGSFCNNPSKEDLDEFVFENRQDFEFGNQSYQSFEFHQTKKFPPDLFVPLDNRPFLNKANTRFDDCEETPRTIGRQDNLPVVDILKQDTLLKIGVLKSNSPAKYGDVWIIYADLSVNSHDEVGSNFLMFGRSSENPNMSFSTQFEISAKHCKVYVVRDEVWVEDTSSNGTYVNRELVGRGNKRILKPEDSLHLYIPQANSDDVDEEEISYVLKEMII